MQSIIEIESAPLADLQLFGSYSRSKENGEKETWEELCNRALLSPTAGLFAIANYSEEQKELVEEYFRQRIAFPSGRFLWCGGTEWLDKPENWHGTFNCVTRNVTSIDDMALCMELSMMGCGVGAVLEPKYINQLPTVKRRVEVEIVGELGEMYPTPHSEETRLWTASKPNTYRLWVGDSRQGWVEAYWHLLDLATQDGSRETIHLKINLTLVRPTGIPLKGFGGVSNPQKLPAMFVAVARVLNGAVGRQLDAVECSLVIDEPAMAIIAGGVRRSAGIRQFSSKDEVAAVAKAGLWLQDESGKWKVDPLREALTMANHTRVFHEKPLRKECVESIRKQWFSGEGAIQWAGETIARANQDLLDNPARKNTFLNLYPDAEASQYLAGLYCLKTDTIIHREELNDRMARYGLNPCFTGDMRLLTVEGYKRFDELEGTELSIINAIGYSIPSKVWCSGKKETICLELANGQSLTCTPDHVFLTTEGERQAKDCEGLQLIYFAINSYIPRGVKNDDYIVRNITPNGVHKVYDFTEPVTHWGIVEGFVVHNCGEKIGRDNHCNLGTVHLAKVDPKDWEGQRKAFEAAALMTAPFLHRSFTEARFARSRMLDPIVLVSFTEAFDFFIRAFGIGWIEWWTEGRPDSNEGKIYKKLEKEYLTAWRDTVHQTVWKYCDDNGLRRPNRCTGVKPEGSLTLLTGAGCCGVHPPKGWRYIRRKEFRKNDPIALAALDYGYSVMPARSDKDENGHLLDDPFDPRCTTWVVEVPVEEAIVAQMPELEKYSPEKFSALAQMDWFMQVQKYYTTHNTSSTVELRQSEIEEVGDRVFELIRDNEGYVSMTFLARFDDHQAFPRLPFEPISTEQYKELMEGVRSRRKSDDFHALVNEHLKVHADLGPRDSACDARGCEL